MKKCVIGILAHVDAGKTTLAESILFLSGIIRKQGKVDDATSTLDSHDIEKKRGITVFSGEANFKWKDTSFTLIDTPGHVDFSAETERAVRVLDIAVLCISAVDGVRPHTRTLMHLLSDYHIPTFIFVTKCDYMRSTEDKIMEQLNSEFKACIKYAPSGKFEAEYENIASLSDSLLEEYIKTEDLSFDSVKKAVYSRAMFPCIFGSGLKNTGVNELLDALALFSNECEAEKPFSAKVYKISHDKSERLTHIKVTEGKICVRDGISIGNTIEKVSQIRIYNGAKYECVNEASKGDVCCLCGLSKTSCGMGLGGEKDDEKPFLESVMRYRISLPDSLDPKNVYLKIKPLEDEDPMLRLTWNESLAEIYADIMGEVQIQVLTEILKTRFGVECVIDKGRVVYKETISGASIGVGHYEPLRHYAEVHLRLEPLKRGSGTVFETNLPVNELNTNYQRLIYTNLTEKKHKGVLIGAEITDIKISLLSARAHIKHTEGGDFRESVYRAVRHGLMRAMEQGNCKILEPYYNYSVHIPTEYSGRFITDICSMNGTYNNPEFSIEGDTVICGRVPVSTICGYTDILASYTSGKGYLSLEFAGYFDCHNQDEVIEEYRYSPTADHENTPDSVFCAHGAGFNVNWKLVENYMHIKD